MWMLIAALTCTNTSARADWCSDNSNELELAQVWYDDYYAGFQSKTLTGNEYKQAGMTDPPVCSNWDYYDSDGYPGYNAICEEWDSDTLAIHACGQQFEVNSDDHNTCWRLLTDRSSCDTEEGGSGGGGGAGSGESCGVYTAMNGAKYYDSADTCYVPSTEYFYTTQGHKYHFKYNCAWSS